MFRTGYMNRNRHHLTPVWSVGFLDFDVQACLALEICILYCGCIHEIASLETRKKIHIF